MARTTDIYCNVCDSKAVVNRTERIHSDLSKLYCSCRNKNCGHRFVMNREFSHTTRTSNLTKDQLLKQALALLSDSDKAMIRKILTNLTDQESR